MPCFLKDKDLCSAVQVEGVEQLVSGEGPPGFRLPATLQQYVEHGGCLFKVKELSCGMMALVPVLEWGTAGCLQGIHCLALYIKVAARPSHVSNS